MRRTYIFFITVSVLGRTLAVLVNRAAYQDTTLEYYDQYDDSVTQSGAISLCWQRGGWLVMPKDQSLDAAVVAVARKKNVWIGLGDYGIEGAYTFIDGSRMNWANWNDVNPDNTIWCRRGNNDNSVDEDCVESHSGHWNDLGCFWHRGYVCQIPNSKRKQYEYSHFKVYPEVSTSTYETASDICRMQNSRLVKINNEYSIGILSKLLPQVAHISFWVNNYGADSSSSCYTTSSDGVTIEKCDETKPFICESVEPHQVKVSNEEFEVDQSSDLQIHCSAFGFPVPEVTWLRDDVEISDQVKAQGHSSMKIHDVTANDAGLYVCRAANVINDHEYRMEAYSIVKVLSDNLSAELNERPPMDDVYGGAKDTAVVSSLESMTDSDMSIPRRLYDDQNGISGFLDQDERRQE